MSKPFKIAFGFPIEHSSETIRITAVAQLHHSNPYYVIDSFHFDNKRQKQDAVSLLPPVEIERVKRKGKLVWMHKDSHRESQLALLSGMLLSKAEICNHNLRPGCFVYKVYPASNALCPTI